MRGLIQSLINSVVDTPPWKPEVQPVEEHKVVESHTACVPYRKPARRRYEPTEYSGNNFPCYFDF